MAASIGPNAISRRSSTTTGTITTTTSAARTPDGSAQVVARRLPGLDEARDALDERLLVRVGRLATVQGRDDPLVDVDTRDLVPARGVLHGQWQADVPQPDDGDPHASTASSAGPAIA